MVIERMPVGGILQRSGLCLVGVVSAPDQPGVGAALFQALGAAQISAHFIVQTIDLNNESHVQFCVSEDAVETALRCVEPVATALKARKLITTRPVALISIFGPDFRERPGIAGTAFGALAARDINILAVSTSISTVSCVIDDALRPVAMDALHDVFITP